MPECPKCSTFGSARVTSKRWRRWLAYLLLRRCFSCRRCGHRFTLPFWYRERIL